MVMVTMTVVVLVVMMMLVVIVMMMMLIIVILMMMMGDDNKNDEEEDDDGGGDDGIGGDMMLIDKDVGGDSNSAQCQFTPQIDGEVAIQLSIKDIKQCFKNTFDFVKKDSDVDNYLFKYSYCSMTVNSTVTEELTGKEYSEHSIVKFYYSKVKLDFPSFNPKSYKPGLDFITLVCLVNMDYGFSRVACKLKRLDSGCE